MLLVERGADVGAVDSNGDSALSAAIKRGLVEASLLLIEKGADLDHMDRPRGEGGQSLLEYAYRRPLMMQRVQTALAEALALRSAAEEGGEKAAPVARRHAEPEVSPGFHTASLRKFR